MNSLLSVIGTLRRSAARPLPVSTIWTQVRHGHQYAPRYALQRKQFKGRVPIRTGGSIKGTTLEFGNYGLRLRSDGVRISASQMKEAENVMMRIIRPLPGVQLYPRLSTNIAVCTKGNETRMGKGKGPFDFWAVRVPTGRILLEIGGELHEQVAREALRLAASKLPGIYEYVSKKSEVPVLGFDKAEPRPHENAIEKLARNPSKDYKIRELGKSPNFATYRR
ncbi:ribosomal protein L10e/L16 [Lipomyces orientalis]|uniref:Ribosomal protein L10e/L16 n=1 Tax=Lipomyces orientalis TaxID=1233043 RepID=A0ACC3THV4_9ASCO